MKWLTKRGIAWGIAALLALGALGLLLVEGPWWFDQDRLDKELPTAAGVIITGFRTMVIALLAGAIAGLGLWYTHKKHELDREQLAQAQEQFKLAQQQFEHAQEQFAATQEKDRDQAELTREGQVTGRYVEASKLIASDSPTERLCGIYAFERIMHDSARDHQTVVEVLTSFIRQQTVAAESRGRELDEGDTAQRAVSADEDVQAAFNVIARRPERPEGFRTNLRISSLRGVHLDAASLQRANLSGAQLQRASLVQASLHRADLSGAGLQDANLQDASLQNADLSAARMEGANLQGARMHSAYLVDAQLQRAKLREAHLHGATLDGANLASADLAGASLHGASLRRTHLEGASLAGAELHGADLSSALGLTVDQVLEATLQSDTRLPDEIANDERVKRHIPDDDLW
ncbi:pentapeptide repeat-containing protein [Streptomyces sp. YC504]|uniref:Pentapeptide repeat-containing protein n=1 Tax=Streptomyces mesophilus TaxID=1775132 RepID=A0A6G4XNF6_9ACTN|nr:pentapeptide repeat-containing protein [Streptomyces mesophilus]NGO78234.1 pentapeptide repeat-containing protein [Streptomyces mesophilus]